MFRSSRLRMHTCKIVLVTSLVWFVLDVAVIMYYSDCSSGTGGWGCSDKKNQDGSARVGGGLLGGAPQQSSRASVNEDAHDLAVSLYSRCPEPFYLMHPFDHVCHNVIPFFPELSASKGTFQIIHIIQYYNSLRLPFCGSISSLPIPFSPSLMFPPRL